ncbi:MAG: tetratricopeptide repeat-containing protein kinase family protein, partial [Bacteroidota bacterium]
LSEEDAGQLRKDVTRAAGIKLTQLTSLVGMGNLDDGRSFVAMEYVEGTSLTDWMKEEHDWRTVVTLFGEIAHGLSAAHEAGLVHRDFKPDNVIVSKTRVVVVDFGVAHALRPSSTSYDDGPMETEPDDPKSGGWIGTPTYMAPEQFLRLTTTAKADQFSFCVALWEAIYREHPYDTSGLLSLYEAVTHGRRRDAPGAPDVPRHVHDALERGLATVATHRHASMHALLDRLRGRTRTRSWMVGAVAGVVATAGFVLAAGSTPAPCPSADDARATLWNDDKAASVREALAASPSNTATSQILAGLDDYARVLADAETTACNARAIATADVAAIDVKARCLQTHRAEFSLLVDAYASAAPHLLARGTSPIDELSSIAACADPAHLRRHDTTASPEDLGTVETLRHSLAQGRVLLAADEAEAALDVLEQARRTAHTLGNPILRAEASLRYATAREAIGDYTDALELAEGAFHEASAVSAWSLATEAAELALNLQIEIEGDIERSAHWERVMQEALRRVAHPTTQLEVQAANASINYFRRAGDLSEAQRVLTQLSVTVPPDAMSRGQRATVEYHAATLASDAGRDDEALARMTDAAELAVAAHGRDTRLHALIQNNLGAIYYRRGDYDAALEAFERSYAARLAFESTPNPTRIGTLNNIAALHGTKGQHDEAIRRLLEIDAYYQEHAASPIDRAVAQYNLGYNFIELDRFEQAAAAFTTAAELHNAALGPTHVHTLRDRVMLGNALARAGRVDEGVALAREALETCRSTHGRNSKDCARMTYRLGKIY